MVEYEFKIGDKVRYKPGFKNSDDDPYLRYGGAGYKENIELTIRKIDLEVLWFEEIKGRGIYKFAIEIPTQELEYTIW